MQTVERIELEGVGCNELSGDTAPVPTPNNGDPRFAVFRRAGSCPSSAAGGRIALGFSVQRLRIPRRSHEELEREREIGKEKLRRRRMEERIRRRKGEYKWRRVGGDGRHVPRVSMRVDV